MSTWITTFKDEIALEIFLPCIREILEEGVTSLTDLQEKFRLNYGCNLPTSYRDIALERLHVKEAFDQKPLITLGKVTPKLIPQEELEDFFNGRPAFGGPDAPASSGGASSPVEKLSPQQIAELERRRATQTARQSGGILDPHSDRRTRI